MDLTDIISIEARSIVSSKDWQPYVQLVLMHKDGSEYPVTQWTPEDAYHHAMNVLSCVEAANTDSFLAGFMRDVVKLEAHPIAGMLTDFRKWREKRRKRPN